jgi:hypothetical protein
VLDAAIIVERSPGSLRHTRHDRNERGREEAKEAGAESGEHRHTESYSQF